MLQKWKPCRQKKEAIRIGNSHPGYPKQLIKPLAVMSHSVSLPVSRNEKRAIPISSSLTNSRTVSKNPDQEKESLKSAKKLDSAIGLSIVVATLIIMLVWGKVCAILSTTAWLYFVPCLVEQNPNRHDQDYDLDEHKKKVVLEGFLERNHRSLMRFHNERVANLYK